jgi:xylan 1,4-beta-xylosidase
VSLSFLLGGSQLPAAESKAVTNSDADSFPVSITVNAAVPGATFRPFWRFFGADEPNYATMPNGRKLIAEIGSLAQSQVYFRAHNLLTSGDGTPALKWGSTGAYDEDASGNPIYNWKILDEIFDGYLQRGVKPYVEIGFMPKAMSVKPEPYQHHWTPTARYEEIYTGWAYPPKNYERWGELAYQWARHCGARYGLSEVESWFWEVWNESNIGYWRGTPEEFLKLHDYAIEGVRRAVPGARVGGPDAAGSGGRFTRAFLEHCLRGTNFATGKIGTPLDFVSFHAKGSPITTNDHVRMGIANQLRTIDDGFKLVASFPELTNTPIVIGECDPEGCAACQGPSLAYRNGTMFSSYNAACFARIPELAERDGVRLEGALTWAFEFEGQPYFAGFRSLASNGLDKPVLNVFRMFSRMSGRKIPVQSDHAFSLDKILRSGVRDQPEVSGIATLDERSACVLLWNYHDDDLPGPAANVELTLRGLEAPRPLITLEHFRIDEDHSNAFAAWKRLGSPQNPTPEQYAKLEAEGRLTQLSPPQSIAITNLTVNLNLTLPRQAVSLVRLSW